MGQTSESLELVNCKEFIGPPGGQSALSQPFEVTVDQQVSPSTHSAPRHQGFPASATLACLMLRLCMNPATISKKQESHA